MLLSHQEYGHGQGKMDGQRHGERGAAAGQQSKLVWQEWSYSSTLPRLNDLKYYYIEREKSALGPPEIQLTRLEVVIRATSVQLGNGRDCPPIRRGERQYRL